MKANELRIGNLVKWHDVSKVLELHSEKNTFDNVYIECEESFEWTEYNKLEPIPLTEEWLLKLGFFKRNGENRFELKNIGVVLLENNCCVDMYDSYNEIISSLTLIQYVHQLQNLYFGLTGAELTVA